MQIRSESAASVKKRYYVKFLLVTVLFAAVVFMLALQPGQTYRAEASDTGSTSGKWTSDGETSNLIPWITDTDTWDSLVAKGWGKANESGTGATLEVFDTERENFGAGRYGVRPSNSGADLGTADYSGGIYYTVHLSEADQMKANLGQLTISASSNNYRQTAASANCSIRAVFLNSNGTELSTIKKTQNLGSSGEQVTLSRTSINDGASNVVPERTASIQIWFSNRNSLNGRPWIANMQCYLHDATSPGVTGITLDDSGVADPQNNAMISGNTFTYTVNFNEHLNVTNAGTAYVSLGSSYYPSSAGSVTHANGVSSITYSFTAPTASVSGRVALSRIDGLSVTDEAGNPYDNTTSLSDAINAAETLQFYKEMLVSYNVDPIGSVLVPFLDNATYHSDKTIFR